MSQQQTIRFEGLSADQYSNAAADVNEKVTALFPAGRDEPAVDQALELFNRMSRQITDSYRTLESRVNQLSGELSAEAQQRRQELEEKECLADRLSTLLAALPAGVVVLDSQGVITQCNPAAIDLLGEPLEGERWLDIIQRCFAPRRDDGHEVSLKDGRRVSIEIRTMNNEPGQLILLTDLTETRRLQSDLARAERLSSMGRMVASLAHQVRTPLSAAMLYAGHLCQPDLTDDLRLRCAEKLMSRLSHLEHQVRDMLIFARGETRLAEQMSLADFVKALGQATEAPVTARGAALAWHSAVGDGRLLCNRDALIGACMNLINNSLEAGATAIRIEAVEEKAVFVLKICDNGPGFDKALRDRLLEAFYTTKSQGTGLGLAVVQAVVHAHKGEFSLDAAEEGAVATLRLPLYMKS
ncbi:sensor histidine kinase [Mangrovitalea sediminis]|uniref:sensor histidine kinase n=1 Tax=Mangrovitalea sediminis TaxID=1982043 RepID=UPI000BE5E04F|nr:ATP-binding protein [Mangrovitalea sediminis]